MCPEASDGHVPRQVPVDASVPCRENDADMWFADSHAGVQSAKELCQRCPAVRECLAGALSRSEPWGVWGGQLLIRGVIVPRKPSRGRPRRAPVVS